MRNRKEKRKIKENERRKKLTAFQFDWHLRFLLGANIIIIIFRFFLVYIYMFILLVAPKLYMEGITSKCLLLYYNFSKLNLFFLFSKIGKRRIIKSLFRSTEKLNWIRNGKTNENMKKSVLKLEKCI